MPGFLPPNITTLAQNNNSMYIRAILAVLLPFISGCESPSSSHNDLYKYQDSEEYRKQSEKNRIDNIIKDAHIDVGYLSGLINVRLPNNLYNKQYPLTYLDRRVDIKQGNDLIVGRLWTAPRGAETCELIYELYNHALSVMEDYLGESKVLTGDYSHSHLIDATQRFSFTHENRIEYSYDRLHKSIMSGKTSILLTHQFNHKDNKVYLRLKMNNDSYNYTIMLYRVLKDIYPSE